MKPRVRIGRRTVFGMFTDQYRVEITVMPTATDIMAGRYEPALADDGVGTEIVRWAPASEWARFESDAAARAGLQEEVDRLRRTHEC